MTTPWQIPGAAGEPILGDCHEPDGEPRGVLVIAHGFKGYKDYGMFPVIAETAAAAGFIAHRFNFSHSGMTNEIETFARPDLFEQDTWNKQVHDLRAVIEAVRGGILAGAGLPLVLFGHSRGGVTTLLTCGRSADDPSFPAPAGAITAAAPSLCNNMADAHVAMLMEAGFLESPSSRTGQVLRVGKAYVQEQLDEPEAHDLASLVAKIRCPLLVVHGDTDPSVPVSSADDIAGAATASVDKLIIEDCNHVFNTTNPPPDDHVPSPQLQQLLDAVVAFCGARCQDSVTSS